MKTRLISIISAVVMLLTLAVGCADTGAPNPAGGEKPTAAEPQLVIAMNPILFYGEDNTSVIAYNEIRNAIKTDYTNAGLNALHQSTAFSWAYNGSAGWQKRGIHTLESWKNGAGAVSSGDYAYTYNAAGSTSLATYSSQYTALGTYGAADTVPDHGLLMSVTGNEEEALSYTFQKDGVLNLSAGVFTAVKSVTGVATGFLAEDGTARSASVRVLINDKQVYSGTLCNSTAAPDGVAVTSLAHEQISNLQIKAGGTLLIAVKLNATANKDEDQSAPPYNDEDNWTTVGHEVKVPIKGDESNGSGSSNLQESDALTILDDYLCRFYLVRDSQMQTDMAKVAGKMRENMEYILETEVIMHNETHDVEKYEIVIGPMASRPESVKLYNELINYRANNANDYLIRRVGTKVYVAATNPQSLEAAADHFLRTFCASEDGEVPANYNYAYQAKNGNATIGGNGIGNFVIRVERNPSTIVSLAAQRLQAWVRENCGYLLPITPMANDLKHYEYEIQIGPMNGDVKVHRTYDTRFTSANMNAAAWSVDPNGYLTGVDYGYFKAQVAGKTLSVNGGSAYAVSAAVARVCEDLKAAMALPKTYAVTGNYRSGTYALVDGYDLKWQDDFSYDTTQTNKAISDEIRQYYVVSSDTTKGPTITGTDADGEPLWDQQRRPGVYGENWWVWNDPVTNNGYLLEITKKESYGYDAGRLVSQNKWAFRYGIWETRFVAGTRNGSCSAVWGATAQPDNNFTVRNEIDVYENFGRDMIVANVHSYYPADMGGHIMHNINGMQHTKLFPREGEQFWDTFHSISLVWTPSRVAFYWDGEMFDYLDSADLPSCHASMIIKFANGVGTGTYAKGYDPQDWMDEAYTAATGKTVQDFFEVQTIDFSYLLQTSNEDKNTQDQSYVKYDRSHPNSEHYAGYLSEIDGWTSAQLPK